MRLILALCLGGGLGIALAYGSVWAVVREQVRLQQIRRTMAGCDSCGLCATRWVWQWEGKIKRIDPCNQHRSLGCKPMYVEYRKGIAMRILSEVD